MNGRRFSWDCTGTVFPDGTFHYDNAFSPAGKPQTEAGLRDRARDFIFVLDYLAQDPVWAARLNPAQAAAMGYSWGGIAVGEFCRIEPRCLAAINLDGGGTVSAALTTAGLQKPSLTVHNPTSSESVLFDKALSGAIWFQVSGTTHDYFTDWYGTVAGVHPGHIGTWMYGSCPSSW